jgi:acylpyruvate hydrolase
MRWVAFSHNGSPGVGFLSGDSISGHLKSDPGFPGSLDEILWNNPPGRCVAPTDVGLRTFPLTEIRFRPPFTQPNKIICVGLNYRDHAAESGYSLPTYPTLFTRFTTTLVAHLSPIVRPHVSEALDFEGELVAVIGRGGRHISESDALSHVAGYSIFNDASVRDFQHRTPQWTVGKNFDGTGALGPIFVTADELPPGAHGLQLTTRLNGAVVQSSNTAHLIFNVATLVSVISEAMTLQPGDLIVTGTPGGVGHSRTPKLYMKPGDVVEVAVEGIGVLRNPIVDEA